MCLCLQYCIHKFPQINALNFFMDKKRKIYIKQIETFA